MRIIPLSALQAMYALEADEFPIILITLSRGEDIIRLSSDATVRISEDPLVYGTVSRTLPFIFFPFEITLPQDQAESAPRMQITVENVSAEIGWWLRSSLTKPVVTVEIVSSSDLDTPLATFPDFNLSSFKGGSTTVQGMLSLSNLEDEPFPGGTFNTMYFPGLF
jgi:hypothetical protein